MKLSRALLRAPALRWAAAVLPLVVAAPLQAQVVLPPATVTATRFAEAAQSLPLGVSVITAEEIDRSGAKTINEALMRILGLPGRQDFFGGGEYNIDLRGFGSTSDVNQVVILDGLRLSEADLGGTRMSAIPIESVERIEVLRGTGAVLYGEGATGGVVVITTKAGTGKERPNGASAYASVGSFATYDARANGNVSNGPFALDASAQHRQSDNDRANFHSEVNSGSATGQWTSEWLRAGATYAQDRVDTGLPGALTAQQYATDPHQTTTPNDHANIQGDRAALFARSQLRDWQVDADAGKREKKLRSISQGFPFDYDISATNASVRARNEATFEAAKNIIVLGVDYQYWTRDVLGTAGSKATQHTDALYLKDDYIFPAGTRLSAGARTERIEKADTNAPQSLSDRLNAWEVGLSQPIVKGLNAYGRVGRSFRLATADEFSFTSPGVALAPQTSQDVELGLRWTHANGAVDARLFRSSLDNEIGFDPNAPGPFGFLGANVNFDPTRRQGLEVDATQALSRTVGVRINATVRQATFRSGPYAGREVPLVPDQTLAVRADWAPAPGQRVSGGVHWVSSQHPDFQNACTVPAYSVADLRYAYAWRQAEFSLGVDNLFDRKYYTQAFGCVAGVTTSIYPEPGRAFTAALRVYF